jgi:hypothetical protein
MAKNIGQSDDRTGAPRSYPEIARPGRLWIKSGRYWIAYSPNNPPVIVGVFYDTADIPGRISLLRPGSRGDLLPKSPAFLIIGV